ncbi:ferric reduction oxidase 2-like [Wolffia australiana]
MVSGILKEEERRKMGSWLSAAGLVRMVSGLIFLGYVVVWMIAPTKRYRLQWQPTLRAATNSAVYGTQGANIIIYTSSVILISILGCIYAHLRKGSRQEQRKRVNKGGNFWKRPALTSGPLGIVSWTELAYLTMFIALIAWYLSVFIDNSFSRITPQSVAKSKEKMWEAKLEAVAFRLGFAGNLVVAFLFIPVTRSSSILPLTGLTSESSVKYHIWLGNICMVFFTLHGFLYVVYWACTGHISEMLAWSRDDVANVAGELALVFGLVLWATSLQRIRRKMFELFFYTHQLYALFLFFYLLHVGIGFFFLVLPGIYLFMIDRFLRFLQSRGRVRLVSARLLPGDTVELNFAKSPSLEYNPLSMVFVNVPAVSKLQWHPFTVASNSSLEPDTLSVIMKKEGSWTQKLHHILDSGSVNRLEVALEGPYGPVSNNFSSYDSLVLISGGSGIVPFISIIREYIFLSSSTPDFKPPKIHLVCSFKTTADLSMLDLLLPISGPVSGLSRLNLRVDAFVTREKAPANKSQGIRALWFKPWPTDEPLAPVLGRHCWLNLGVIIVFSFGSFIGLYGLMNSNYQHGSNSAKALLGLLIICGAIAGTSTIAFLLNKQRHSNDAKKAQITVAPSPNFAEREMESEPQESLAQSTIVSYGERPDLKKILMEQKSESVGVLVSGPKEMRRHVAVICSSTLSRNLHYGSMSFSW